MLQHKHTNSERGFGHWDSNTPRFSMPGEREKRLNLGLVVFVYNLVFLLIPCYCLLREHWSMTSCKFLKWVLHHGSGNNNSEVCWSTHEKSSPDRWKKKNSSCFLPALLWFHPLPPINLCSSKISFGIKEEVGIQLNVFSYSHIIVLTQNHWKYYIFPLDFNCILHYTLNSSQRVESIFGLPRRYTLNLYTGKMSF